MAHRPLIEKNLTELCDLSYFETRFLTTCQQEEILTREQTTKIELQPAGFGRNALFYQILYQKDNEAFQKVMRIMADRDTRQSGDVLRIFESIIDNNGVVGLPVVVTPLPTRALREEDVHWIVRYFMDSPDMVEGQTIFYSGLKLRLSELFDLQNSTRMSGASSYNFFSGCLTKWIGQQPTEANFTNLIAILRELNFNSVAEKIIEDLDTKPVEDARIALGKSKIG